MTDRATSIHLELRDIVEMTDHERIKMYDEAVELFRRIPLEDDFEILDWNEGQNAHNFKKIIQALKNMGVEKTDNIVNIRLVNQDHYALIEAHIKAAAGIKKEVLQNLSKDKIQETNLFEAEIKQAVITLIEQHGTDSLKEARKLKEQIERCRNLISPVVYTFKNTEFHKKLIGSKRLGEAEERIDNTKKDFRNVWDRPLVQIPIHTDLLMNVLLKSEALTSFERMELKKIIDTTLSRKITPKRAFTDKAARTPEAASITKSAPLTPEEIVASLQSARDELLQDNSSTKENTVLLEREINACTQVLDQLKAELDENKVLFMSVQEEALAFLNDHDALLTRLMQRNEELQIPNTPLKAQISLIRTSADAYPSLSTESLAKIFQIKNPRSLPYENAALAKLVTGREEPEIQTLYQAVLDAGNENLSLKGQANMRLRQLEHIQEAIKLTLTESEKFLERGDKITGIMPQLKSAVLIQEAMEQAAITDPAGSRNETGPELSYF